MSETTDMTTLLANMQKEYSVWSEWVNQFCTVWTQVIQIALQSEQTSMEQMQNITPEQIQQYIKGLEIQYMTQLYTCDVQYPVQADYTFISQTLPSDTTIFGTTLDFMNVQISRMIQQTEGALKGIAPSPPVLASGQTSAEAFADVSGPSSQKTVQAPTHKEVNAIISRLKGLNSSLDALNQKMQQAQAGIAQLNQYKESAQNGTLITQVSIPQ